MKKAMFDKDWFRLDNAAKIYPAARSSRWNAVFRMAAVMKEEVDPARLQQALEDVIDRFPMFRMTLKKGFFWYYLQYVEKTPRVEEEKDYPCRMIRLNGRDYLFRVLYHAHRISIEVFHSVTDGTGGLAFLKTLLARYIELGGGKIADYQDVLHYEDDPVKEEVDDAFSRYSDKKYGTLSRNEPAAYQVGGQKENDEAVVVTQGEIDFDRLHEVAKSYDCTVNTYLTSIVEYVLMKRQLYDNKTHKPVRVQVPVNLRKFFPSTTLRNFSGFINTQISADDKTFEEVCRETGAFISERINEDYCRKFINSNIAIERNPIVRIIPRALKSVVMKLSFYAVGERCVSCCFSNIGNVKAPAEFYEHVDRIEFIIGSKYISNAMTCVTFDGKTVITFSRTIKDGQLERDFFRMLAEHGIKVRINSNGR